MLFSWWSNLVRERASMYGIGTAGEGCFDVIDGNVLYFHHSLSGVENDSEMVVEEEYRVDEYTKFMLFG